MDNRMFTDYIVLLADKNKWQAKMIEFREFEISLKVFCKEYGLNEDMILYSLNVFPV